MQHLKHSDLEIANLIKEEFIRQQQTINLIASENYTSREVMQAQGSELTNKYAEGYPKARYYGGCNIIDKIETIAINRAKKLFSAEHANVQPHSGSNANLSIYMSSVLPGDTIMSMALDHGGHLTHGSKVNFTGKLYNFIKYGVDRYNGLIDYNKIETLANKYLPKLIIAGASAYTRIIDFKRFGKIAKNINAKLMVDMAHISGLVAAQLHPSPIEYSDYISSTTHKTLRGPRGGIILCKKNYKRKIDSNVFPGIQGGPLEHIIAAKAIALKEASSQNFKIYQTQVIKNAKTLASSLINYEFNLVSGGTDNHLILIDLRNKNISGKEAEELLDHVNIVVNKNKIPYDNTNAKVTSGLRLGTPSITTRGMKSLEMKELAKLISQAIYYRKQNQKLNLIKNKALELALSFPLNEQYQNSYIIK